ncbi:helix-turn-helix domain-containing protein [Zobellia galactanivorans]|uniref:helix-turn-helix domain-containing protein n=1 Tax=Zobellia galactanivorans (strain DSM 12802 / CCUG 47099 / CIP 106680 / NCIMB 13871 / Dsij) TaxID=63186 RepID=UPI001C0726E3|nr:helix-turn-helix domain-containing protein [Zobellia galactanivorans]MBU3028420.1 helix-turn-helix domain-containing protein [Zobellia galactanivorans]
MNLKRIVIVLFILVSLPVVGQPYTTRDVQAYLIGLEKLVDEQLAQGNIVFDEKGLLDERSRTKGKEKVQACFKLYNFYIYKSPELAEDYNNESLELSKEIAYTEGYLQSITHQAFIYFMQGKFDQASELLDHLDSEKLIDQYPKIIADNSALKSYIHTERGAYDLALDTSLKNLRYGEAIENPYVLMKAYSSISHLYLRLGQYEKALENCLKGIDHSLVLKRTQNILPKIDEMARMVHVLQGSRPASEIYTFYLKLKQKLPAPGGYIESAVFMNIASIYIEQGEFALAEQYLNRVFELINENEYRFRLPRAYILRAELSLKRADTTAAIKSYTASYGTARKINAFDVVKDVSQKLAKLHQAKGNVELGQSFSAIHWAVRDSLFSLETNQRIQILEASRRINEISKEKEILEIRTKNQEERYVFILLVLTLTLISGGIATYSYFKVRKKNRLLFYRTKELIQEKIHQQNKAHHSDKPKETVPKRFRSHEYIDEDIKEIILIKLKKFEKNNDFLNQKCSLSSLSEELQTNQKYLSQVINHEKKSNFNNYINELRINYLLKRLVEDEDFRNSKLSYIASVCGFNNQNTFYSAFKKRLGILPSYFIKQLNEEKEKEQN